METCHVVYIIVKMCLLKFPLCVLRDLKDHNIIRIVSHPLVHISISYDKAIQYSISYDMRNSQFSNILQRKEMHIFFLRERVQPNGHFFKLGNQFMSYGYILTSLSSERTFICRNVSISVLIVFCCSRSSFYRKVRYLVYQNYSHASSCLYISNVLFQIDRRYHITFQLLHRCLTQCLINCQDQRQQLHLKIQNKF